MSYRSIFAVYLRPPEVCLCHTGQFVGLSMPHKSICGVYLRPIGRFEGSIYAPMSSCGVYLCPTGQFSGSLYALQANILGSVYAPRVNFWGLSIACGRNLGRLYAPLVNFGSIPHWSNFAVYLCRIGQFLWSIGQFVGLSMPHRSIFGGLAL